MEASGVTVGLPLRISLARSDAETCPLQISLARSDAVTFRSGAAWFNRVRSGPEFFQAPSPALKEGIGRVQPSWHVPAAAAAAAAAAVGFRV